MSFDFPSDDPNGRNMQEMLLCAAMKSDCSLQLFNDIQASYSRVEAQVILVIESFVQELWQLQPWPVLLRGHLTIHCGVLGRDHSVLLGI